jgi:hypothetical protein
MSLRAVATFCIGKISGVIVGFRKSILCEMNKRFRIECVCEEVGGYSGAGEWLAFVRGLPMVGREREWTGKLLRMHL